MNTMATVPHEANGTLKIHRARQGQTVRVDFMAWLDDGTLIDTSIYHAPLTFTIGRRSVMYCIENLVSGMAVGESKTERVPAALHMGPYRPELSCQVNPGWLYAQGIEARLGLEIHMRQEDGTVTCMRITRMNVDRVTLDANHRLAGKDLILQLDLLEIVDRKGSGTRPKPAPAA